jgi:hypothetical protein
VGVVNSWLRVRILLMVLALKAGCVVTTLHVFLHTSTAHTSQADQSITHTTIAPSGKH